MNHALKNISSSKLEKAFADSLKNLFTESKGESGKIDTNIKCTIEKIKYKDEEDSDITEIKLSILTVQQKML